MFNLLTISPSYHMLHPCTHHTNNNQKKKNKTKNIAILKEMLRSSTLTHSVTVTCVRQSHRQWHQSIPANYRVCDAARNTLLSNSAIFKWKTKSNTKRNSSGMGTFTTRALAQPLKNADELIDSVETFIFDCDGMLLISNASTICISHASFHFYTDSG